MSPELATTARMRVGIDITPLQVPVSGGIGVATYRTLLALAKPGDLDLVLYGTSEPLVPFSGEPLDLEGLGLPLRLGSGPLAHSNIAWLQLGLASMLAADEVDVFWGTRHVLPRRPGSVATVATLYDLWFARHPEQQPVVNRVVNRSVITSSVRKATLLAPISESTAAEARELYGAPDERLRVVPLGVEASEFARSAESEAADAAVLARLGVTRPYVLLMDAYNPRKNARLVLEAVARLGADAGDIEIAVLGAPRTTAVEVDIPAVALALRVNDRVRLLGDVSSEDLKALYRGTHAFVYPSVYEGFGMPVLEAMASGAPVITSTTSSLPEVAGKAAITVDPTSPSALADALRGILTDEGHRERLSARGIARAAEFTWERTAEGMRQVFRDALELKRRSRS